MRETSREILVENQRLELPSKRFRERLHGFKVRLVIVFQRRREKFQCVRSSFSKAAVASVALVAPTFAEAQAVGPVESPGLSYSGVDVIAGYIASAIAAPLHLIVWLYNYVSGSEPAAVLFSTLIAAIIAIVSIRVQRATTKLRETFAAVLNENWDEDFIKARRVYAEVRRSVAKNPQEIAKYGYPTTARTVKERREHEAIAGTLQTMINHYENIGIGIRLNVLDEHYLYSFLRGAVLRDWESMRHLATAYRDRTGNLRLYIEFERLAEAWGKRRSYCNGRRMEPSGWKRWLTRSKF